MRLAVVDFGACGKCGSYAMPCKCMLGPVARPLGKKTVEALLPARHTAAIRHAMRVAAYHNDAQEHARLYMAGNITGEESKAIWEEGLAARTTEVCNCRACCKARFEARNG